MVLSDRDIKKALKEKRIKVTPALDLETQLGSNSIDLRLGKTFRIFEHSKFAYIDPFHPEASSAVTKEITVRGKDHFIMQPGDFVLGTTVEYLEIPDDMVGNLEGRSSIGRLGVIVHSTAASIECGYEGKITLELANMGKMPVALYPGMRICSVSFMTMTSPADVPYTKKKNAKYVGQMGPKESGIHKEK